MKRILTALFSVVSIATAAPLVFEGTEGPGKGKHIVFLAGDHEYRSEETLPALARILGISEASVSRLANGTRSIAPDSKEGELALLLVRVYRSLDALVGGDDTQRRAWMHSANRALNGKPSELIRSAEGLVVVASYLDGMRTAA